MPTDDGSPGRKNHVGPALAHGRRVRLGVRGHELRRDGLGPFQDLLSAVGAEGAGRDAGRRRRLAGAGRRGPPGVVAGQGQRRLAAVVGAERRVEVLPRRGRGLSRPQRREDGADHRDKLAAGLPHWPQTARFQLISAGVKKLVASNPQGACCIRRPGSPPWPWRASAT